jgi:pimeloyl-ACP methyl ester carboxylesterase
MKKVPGGRRRDGAGVPSALACRGSRGHDGNARAGAMSAIATSPAATGAGLFFKEYGSGPPLVLVHGLMVSGDMFEPVIPRFAEHHRLIVPDLRGHGKSRHLPPPYTVDRLAGDVAELLAQLGINQADVLGYSHGGAVAQQLAIDHPECVHKLVLACTYAYNLASVREKFEGLLLPILVSLLGTRRLGKLVVSQGAKELSQGRAEWLASLIAANDRKLMVPAVRAMTYFDSRPRLRDIRAPTLVIAGSIDTAVPMHHAKMLVNGIPNARLEIVPGAGHTMVWTHPDALVGRVEAFLHD